MTPMDDVARELGLLLRSLKGLHVPLVVDGGARVEMPAAAVLATLDDRGRLRLSTLAELLHLDLSSVSRQVATLVEEGWVSRERDPADSRAWLLELTATGRDVLARVRAGRVHRLRELLPDWSDGELEAFAGVLHRFRTDLTGGDQPRGDLAGSCADTAPPASLVTAARSPQPDRTPALAGQESR